MTVMPMPPHKIGGLSAIVDQYRGVILDLWGVVHDGVRALPGAVEALTRLREGAVPVCLLSNAPRRAGGVIRQLADLGVDPALYDHLVTSGELTFEAMRTDWAEAAYIHLGPSFLAGLADGCGCREVSALNAADFILCTGTDRVETIDALLPMLHGALGHDLPMLCANPDREVMIGERRVLCAGAIAEAYRTMGGNVRSIGKPYPQVYGQALGLLGIGGGAILAAGDSYATDLKGANGMGIDALFITSGIHRDLFDDAGDPFEDASWAALTEQFDARPQFAMTKLCW